MRSPDETPRRRIAPRRARDPVVEVTCGERDVARRSWYRSSSRCGDLAALDAEVGADRVFPRRGRLHLTLLGKGQARDVSETARFLRARDPGSAELSPVEGRTLEDVGDLVCGSSRRRGRAAPPRGGSRPPARASLPPEGRTSRRPQRRRQGGSRWGSPVPRRDVGEKAGGAGEDGNRLDDGRNEAQVEQHGGDRHRDVHRQRLAPGVGDRVAEGTREGDAPARAALVGKFEDTLRSRSSGRCTGCPKPGTLPPFSLIAPANFGRSRVGLGPRRDLSPRLLEQPRASPRYRGRRGRHRESPPRPRSEATPSAASAIRAATLVGIIPCSAMATRSRSRK